MSGTPSPARSHDPQSAQGARIAPLVFLVVVGLPWVGVIALLPEPVGAIWSLSALGLWFRELVRLSRGNGWKAVGTWWLMTLVAPAALLVVVVDAATHRRRTGAPVPVPAAATPAPMSRGSVSGGSVSGGSVSGGSPRPAAAPPVPAAVLSRLDDAERRVRSLERELRELRALVAAPQPAQAAAASPAAAAAAPVARPVATQPPPVAAPAPAAPPARAAETRPPRLPALTVSDLLGARGLAWAGGIVTLLGVVFLFVLAVNRGWIGPAERVSIGALASALVLCAGVVARRRYGQLDAALAAVGAGLAGGYATLLAATALYDLVDQGVALVLAAGIAAVGTAVALAWSAEILAGIGLVGAALAPGAIALDSGIETLGTAFAALVFAALAVVAQRRGWTWLLVAGVVATAPQAFALVASERDAASSSSAVVVATMLVALYLAAAVVRGRAAPRLDPLTSTLVPLSASLGVAAAFALLDRPGAGLLVLALPYAALAVGLFAPSRELAALLAAAAMVVSALGFADLLGGAGLTLAWALQAAALAWLAGRTVEPRFAAASLGYLALAAGHTVAFDAPPTDLYRAGSDPAAGIPAVLVVGVAAALVAWFARGWQAPATGGGRLVQLFARVAAARRYWVAGAGAVAALAAVDAASLGTLALVDAAGAEPPFAWGRVAVAVLWSALGAAAFAAGAWTGRRPVWIAGGVWLAVTVADTLAFDLVELPHTQAGWAAAAVAAGLLAAGFLAELAREPRPVPAALASVAAILGSAGLAATAVGLLLESDAARGLACLGVAAVDAIAAAAVFRREDRRDGATSLWAVALASALAGALLLLDGTVLVLATAAGAVALAWLLGVTGERRLAFGALAFLAVAAGVTFVELAPPADLLSANETPADGAPAAGLVAAALAAIAALVRRPSRPPVDAVDRALDAVLPPARPVLTWAAAATALYAGSLLTLGVVLELGRADLTTEFQRGHTAVSAVWGVVALVLLYAGLRRGAQPLRLAGFALFGAALVKLFLYDLSTLSSVTRALSFLAVGAVLLLAGFFYQRLAGPRGGGPRAA
ncbi:MAG TPA: DUF2339 domain-containing protein [Gaiellaceae bacterium]|nr:DUF2339 domain-containing protein [Gaiellaceae bacterium]